MTRVTKQVTFPLSAATEAKIRVDYKARNGLAKNSTMESVYRNLGIFNKAQAYGAMADLYNQRIEQENSAIVTQRKVVKNEKAKASRLVKKTPAPKTFVITLNIEVTYLKSFYEFDENIRYAEGTVRIIQMTSNPTTDLANNIPKIADTYTWDDGYKKYKVLSYTVAYMDVPKLEQNKKPKIKQRMRRSFVLANNWLKYSHGIAKSAYETTDNRCVYNQLVQYLSDPPSNLPSNFVYFTNGKNKV